MSVSPMVVAEEGGMTYAIDGRCHNSEPYTYGHECGKPAKFVGETTKGFRCGFCADCRQHGAEAAGIVQWAPFDRAAELIRYVKTKLTDNRGFVDEVAMRATFDALAVPVSERLEIWRAATAHWAA